MLEKFLNSMAQREQQDAPVAPPSPPSKQQQAQPRQQRAEQQQLGWVAPVLFVLLQSPLNSDPAGFGSKLLMRISRVVSVTVPARERLPVRLQLTRLLSTLPGDVLAARCVRPVQRYIDGCVRAGLGATRVQVMMAGVLLDILRQASEDGGGIIPYTEFHNAQLSEHANLQAEYVAWRQNTSTTALCSICQVGAVGWGGAGVRRVRCLWGGWVPPGGAPPAVGGMPRVPARLLACLLSTRLRPPSALQMPYLLTPEAKSFIMHGEAAMQQQQHLSAAAMQVLLLTCLPPDPHPSPLPFCPDHPRRRVASMP